MDNRYHDRVQCSSCAFKSNTRWDPTHAGHRLETWCLYYQQWKNYGDLRYCDEWCGSWKEAYKVLQHRC